MNRIHHSSGKESFREAMEDATSTMPSYQRIFSRAIHSTFLSIPIDLLGRVVFRPMPLLIGAVLAFSFMLTSYLTAKNLGYSLSGFESIGAFIVGWLLGLLYDFVRAATSSHS